VERIERRGQGDDYVKLPSKDVQLVDPSGRKVVAVIEQKDATGSSAERMEACERAAAQVTRV
jgi:hypothetical protein